MQKFQELLTQAAQLKQAQLKNERKNYESLPDYLKSGLNFSKKYQLLRKQDYLIQMNISQKLKKQGNNLFKIDHYQEALNKYQESLSVFRFILAKTYDNMKDDDLVYENYTLPQTMKDYTEEYNTHLVALYLNICSCLTKQNKKQDAIHSADQALKIKQTAKGYYKKAQAYLQFINKQAADIKLGFYYLNKSYQLSKDPSIIQQMHKIKKQIDDQRDKEKKWFKFMFDKNSKAKLQNEKLDNSNKIQVKQKQEISDRKQKKKSTFIKNFQREKGEQPEEDVRLEKTKQKLTKYTSKDFTDEEWVEQYDGQFIAKHGSKIYSIIQLYGYKQYLGEYKSLLAQCLQYRKQETVFSKRRQLYSKYFQWLKQHPIDKISKYIERYDLQTKWIKDQRQKCIQNKIEQNKKLIEADVLQKDKESQVVVKEQIEREERIIDKQQNQIRQQRQVQQKQPHGQGQKQLQINNGKDKFVQVELNPVISSAKSNIKFYSILVALLIILILSFAL